MPKTAQELARDLYIAANDGNVNAARAAIEAGADVNSRHNFVNNDGTVTSGVTPLHVAAFHGNAAMANLLLEKGADPSAKNGAGVAPLHLAAEQGNSIVVDSLLANGADPEARNGNGKTPSDVTPYVPGNHPVWNRLQQQRTANGFLMTAIQEGNVDNVQIALDNRAQANLKNAEGMTPLHLAVLQPNATIAGLLIDSGADVNAKMTHHGIGGVTPLHLAAEKGNVAAVNLLLAKGADIRAIDSHGRTPKDVAQAQPAVVQAITDIEEQRKRNQNIVITQEGFDTKQATITSEKNQHKKRYKEGYFNNKKKHAETIIEKAEDNSGKVLGVACGIVGAVFGGPIGFAIGAAIGAAIGQTSIGKALAMGLGAVAAGTVFAAETVGDGIYRAGNWAAKVHDNSQLRDVAKSKEAFGDLAPEQQGNLLKTAEKGRERQHQATAEKKVHKKEEELAHKNSKQILERLSPQEQKAVLAIEKAKEAFSNFENAARQGNNDQFNYILGTDDINNLDAQRNLARAGALGQFGPEAKELGKKADKALGKAFNAIDQAKGHNERHENYYEEPLTQINEAIAARNEIRSVEEMFRQGREAAQAETEEQRKVKHAARDAMKHSGIEMDSGVAKLPQRTPSSPGTGRGNGAGRGA